MLEDRILKIIELKEQGLDSNAIAKKLGLNTTVINNSYDVTLLAFKGKASMRDVNPDF